MSRNTQHHPNQTQVEIAAASNQQEVVKDISSPQNSPEPEPPKIFCPIVLTSQQIKLVEKPIENPLSRSPITPSKSQMHEKATEGSDKKPSQSPIDNQICGCSKSGCLKLYCICFAKGILCGSECSCVGCKNDTDNPDRSEAIHEVILANPMAFSRRNQEFGLTAGCNCRKSGCMKKYCECFRRGKRCLDKCNCFQCKNMEEGHVKTQNRTLPSEDTFRLTFDLLKKKIKLP